MKNLIIGTLVGGILIFAWSAISWMVLPTHYDTYQYNSDQDAIMRQLIQLRTMDGVYAMPAVDDRKMAHGTREYQEADMALKQENEGKPWVMLMYMHSMNPMDGKMLGYGFLYDLLVAFGLCYAIYHTGPGVNFWGRFMLCMVIGLAFLARGPLTAMNWQGYPMSFFRGDIIDIIVETILAGAFISWLYRKPKYD